MKKVNGTPYTVEREFLGRIRTDEFIENIIKKHCANACRDNERNYDRYEKTVEKSCNL